MTETGPDVTDLIARAIADPGKILPRVDGESVARWGARAVEATLAKSPQHSEAGAALYETILTALARQWAADMTARVERSPADHQGVFARAVHDQVVREHVILPRGAQPLCCPVHEQTPVLWGTCPECVRVAPAAEGGDRGE